MSRRVHILQAIYCSIILLNALQLAADEPANGSNQKAQLLPTEKLAGDGIWTDPELNRQGNAQQIRVKVWFEEQFLGDGTAYLRRAKEFENAKRRELRDQVRHTLKTLSKNAFAKADGDLKQLVDKKKISDLQRHWIVNGFTCTIEPGDIDLLRAIPGVKKIFVVTRNQNWNQGQWPEAEFFKPAQQARQTRKQYLHPWYIRYLLVDKVWQEFGVTGKNTLNVIHDFQFQFSENLTQNLYRNPAEVPGNNKDDDNNGLVDDYHGFNFDRDSAQLKPQEVPKTVFNPGLQHGFECAAIVCGTGTSQCKYEFGIAPEGRWAGVIASQNLERAIEWAIEQSADTYSMSFSIPNLGEYRSHWRKIMEHGSFCGVYFVSGAGNFAQRVAIPVQMRTPEDIPEVVFAAAGIQRDFSRTPFSSKGPVRWETEHYRDGLVQKPEVCAFNYRLPALTLDGNVLPQALNGNSFAGPMFCGAIALMLSADPDLLPWDLKEIITSTATDVADAGVDDETGHGLINCYRAVKEVLRRKAIRAGKDASMYTGRVTGDELDIKTLEQKYKASKMRVETIIPGKQADQLGIQVDDVIVSYNGVEITGQQQLLQIMQQASLKKLDEVKLMLLRGGKQIELKVKPGLLGVTTTRFDEPVFQ